GVDWEVGKAKGGGAPDGAPFAYGGPGHLPVVGDWDGDRVTTVGVFDPATATWRLRNSNTPGAPDVAPFAYGDGPSRSRPVMGAYGPGALLQATGGAEPLDEPAAPALPQGADGAGQAAPAPVHAAPGPDHALGLPRPSHLACAH